MSISANISDGYSVEEREEQIAAVRRLSRKKREKNLLRPKSLIDALTSAEPPPPAEVLRQPKTGRDRVLPGAPGLG